jgi:hypothetical protein
MDFSSKVWCRGCLLGFLSFYWCRIWLCDFCNYWNWFWLVRCWGDRGSLRSERGRVFVWVWGELTPVAYTLRLSIGRQPCEAEAKHQELNYAPPNQKRFENCRERHLPLVHLGLAIWVPIFINDTLFYFYSHLLNSVYRKYFANYNFIAIIINNTIPRVNCPPTNNINNF